MEMYFKYSLCYIINFELIRIETACTGYEAKLPTECWEYKCGNISVWIKPPLPRV